MTKPTWANLARCKSRSKDICVLRTPNEVCGNPDAGLHLPTLSRYPFTSAIPGSETPTQRWLTRTARSAGHAPIPQNPGSERVGRWARRFRRIRHIWPDPQNRRGNVRIPGKMRDKECRVLAWSAFTQRRGSLRWDDEPARPKLWLMTLRVHPPGSSGSDIVEPPPCPSLAYSSLLCSYPITRSISWSLSWSTLL